MSSCLSLLFILSPALSSLPFLLSSSALPSLSFLLSLSFLSSLSVLLSLSPLSSLFPNSLFLSSVPLILSLSPSNNSLISSLVLYPSLTTFSTSPPASLIASDTDRVFTSLISTSIPSLLACKIIMSFPEDIPAFSAFSFISLVALKTLTFAVMFFSWALLLTAPTALFSIFSSNCFSWAD